MHILKFKTLTNCVRRYKTPKFNLHDEVRRLRQETVDWNESLLDENDADMTILGNQNNMGKKTDYEKDDELLRSSLVETGMPKTRKRAGSIGANKMD